MPSLRYPPIVTQDGAPAPDALQQLEQQVQAAHPEVQAAAGIAIMAFCILGLLLCFTWWQRQRAGQDPLPRRQPQAPLRWGPELVIGVILGYIVLAQLMMVVVPVSFEGLGALGKVALGSLTTALTALGAFFLVRALGGWPAVEPPRSRVEDLKLGALAYGAIFPFIIGTMVLSTWWFDYLGQEPQINEALVAAFETTTLVGELMLVVAVVVVAPLAEELFFRGILYPSLRPVIGPWPAILASAILFMLVHPPVNYLPIFLLGVAMAYLYERTHSLVAPMTVHALNNGLMFFWFLTLKHLAG